jgi:hypothetical protein
MKGQAMKPQAPIPILTKQPLLVCFDTAGAVLAAVSVMQTGMDIFDSSRHPVGSCAANHVIELLPFLCNCGIIDTIYVQETAKHSWRSSAAPGAGPLILGREQCENRFMECQRIGCDDEAQSIQQGRFG